jgi:alpha 1,2-mannosyltransferase
MIKHQALYLANQKELDYDYILPGLTLVRNLTADYIIKKKITVRNPDMLADVFNRTVEIPNFWNNFEVVDLSFMRRKEVVDFIEAVDESKGIFLYRWGDAPLRYITLALFANASQILHRHKLGLDYCHPC